MHPDEKSLHKEAFFIYFLPVFFWSSFGLVRYMFGNQATTIEQDPNKYRRRFGKMALQFSIDNQCKYVPGVAYIYELAASPKTALVMTRILLTITTLLFVSLTFSQPTSDNNYILTIKKGKVEKQSNQTIWLIPTSLTNYSKDTLKYFSMSCSWQNFYSVDNKKLQIEIALCDKNIPTILMLAPGQTTTVEIRLLISQTMDASEIKFKIGLNLMNASHIHTPLDFDFKEEQKKKNVIWSNLISM